VAERALTFSPAVAVPGDAAVPVAPSRGRLRPLGIGEVRLAPGFWHERQERNAEATIGHCRTWEDRVGWTGNFRAAVEGRLPGDRQGRNFADSDVYKLLEAMCWEFGRAGDGDLNAEAARLAAEIAAVQEPDGYLNTNFGRAGQAGRYSDLEWGHELYCYGHLIQAGVAALRGGAAGQLFEVARRAADHVCAEFGPGGRDGVCGHAEIEMALVELYRATGEARYLEQASLFVERRGHHVLDDIELGRDYFQDDLPIRQAGAFRGHAVRALYLACGAVDVAVETGDGDLLAAIVRQWERTVAARTYLTGGMGARHTGESFGEDYELPPDRAYAETCAGIASVMLSWRLLLATGEPRFADLAERTMYNLVATSPALDGRAFFYTNTLYQRRPGTVPSRDEASPRAHASLRAPWFNVSCCPTNVARTMASLAGYVATVDDGGVQLHQLTACTLTPALPDGRTLGLRVETGYPWKGTVTVRVEAASGGQPARIALRVPAWAGAGAVLHGPEGSAPVGPGYAVVERAWRAGDELRLELPVAPRWTRPDPRIDAVRGCVAVERGPIVYCAEIPGDDQGHLDGLAVDTSTPPVEATGAASTEAGGAIHLTVKASPLSEPGTGPSAGLPYGERPAGGERAAHQAATEPLPLIPYHRWGNRGPATMRVWLPEAVDTATS
jgi:DUF1680 family protein